MMMTMTIMRIDFGVFARIKEKRFVREKFKIHNEFALDWTDAERDDTIIIMRIP